MPTSRVPPPLNPTCCGLHDPDRKRPGFIVLWLPAAIFMFFAMFVGQATASRVNFAKFQKVTASSHNSTYSPDFALDGIVSNFHSYRTGNTGPHWLELSYPRAVTLASAHLYSGLFLSGSPTQIIGKFKFQYHNGTAWIDVPGSSVNGNNSPEANVVFSAPVTSDRFRLYCTDNGSRAIRELALFPPNLVDGVEQGFPIGTDVTLNLAYKRPSSASSASLTNQYGAGYAKNGFDGYLDNKSRWVSTNAIGEYLEADLLADHAIGSAHVYTGYIDEANPLRQTTQPMPDFTLQYWTGSAWLPIPGSEITGNTQVARVVNFSETVTTSRVRIVTTSVFNGRVQELLLFPPRDGGYYALGREVIDAAPPTTNWETHSDDNFMLRSAITPDDRRLGYSYGTVVFTSGGTGGRPALAWQLLRNYRDGSYRVRHNSTGQCLALSAIAFTDNNPVVLEEYSAMPHQDWFLEPVDATHYRIINAYSGMALQSRFSQWTAGNPMAVRPPSGDNLQHWRKIQSLHHLKKGIAATQNPAKPVPWGTEMWMDNSYPWFPNSSWSYSWGRQTNGTFPYMTSNHTFNPMQWGDFNWFHSSTAGAAGPIDLLRRDLHSNPKPVHLMAFNEPDKETQGFISVQDAIMRWPRLEAMEVPLVSPVPANAVSSWNTDFKTQADALGYRRDSTAVHWYGSPVVGSPATASADNLINHLTQVYNTFGQRPVWLTEFSTVDWSQSSSWSHADNYEFLAEFMWRAESLTWLKRYSLFQFVKAAPGSNQSAPDPVAAPRSNARNENGTLTAFGELYAAWDGVITPPTNGKAYHIHNRGQYRRLHNGGDALAGSTVPEDSGTGTQWFLTPGINANTMRIISTRDGRPLRFFAGGNVSFGSVGQDTTVVEWRITADAHGRFFVEHPLTNQRLRLNSDGTFEMVAITNTGDNLKWRFINALTPDPVAPPETPAGLNAQATTSQITVSWQPSAGAANYNVERADDLTGPWVTLASGLTLTEWSDSSLPSATTFHYRITATNGLGSSAPSATISATTEPEPLTLPETPAGLAAQVVGTQVNLTWSTALRAASYKIHRSTSQTGPWQTVIENLGSTHWENTGLAYGTTYYYTVAAVNEIGASDPSAPVSAIIAAHPLATYEGWTQMFLNGLPPEAQTTDANPDEDALNNLLEFVFLTLPTQPDGNPFKVHEVADDTMIIEFPWNWRADGHSWQLLHGADLSNLAAWPVVVPQTVTATRDGDIDLIRVTAPMTQPDRGFFVLKVTAN